MCNLASAVVADGIGLTQLVASKPECAVERSGPVGPGLAEWELSALRER